MADPGRRASRPDRIKRSHAGANGGGLRADLRGGQGWRLLVLGLIATSLPLPSAGGPVAPAIAPDGPVTAAQPWTGPDPQMPQWGGNHGGGQPPLLIPLVSAQGQALLNGRGTLRADEPLLAQWFETQANLAFCGAASAVMVLNSLGQPAPLAAGYGSHRFWTQTNLFEAAATQRFVRATLVAREGMTLEQLDGLLAAQGLRVSRYHGDQLSLAQLRLLLRRGLADPGDRLLVNYDRASLGQKGGGHISPLAAYDPRGDRVLILDVARYRYPAVWVATPLLWQALRSLDRSSGRSRGLISASRPAPRKAEPTP